MQEGSAEAGVRKVVMIWKAEEQECQCLPQLLQHCIWGCPLQLDLGMGVGLQSLFLSLGKSQMV